jgi:hypothetical protein
MLILLLLLFAGPSLGLFLCNHRRFQPVDCTMIQNHAAKTMIVVGLLCAASLMGIKLVTGEGELLTCRS